MRAEACVVPDCDYPASPAGGHRRKGYPNLAAGPWQQLRWAAVQVGEVAERVQVFDLYGHGAAVGQRHVAEASLADPGRSESDRSRLDVQDARRIALKISSRRRERQRVCGDAVVTRIRDIEIVS